MTRDQLGHGGTLTITTWTENPFAFGRSDKRVTLATIECAEDKARAAYAFWRQNNQPLQVEAVWQASPKFLA